MTLGKTIKIYLQNGSTTGIRHYEITNWTIQALFVPRLQIKELAGWDESKKPGVYFLFGEDVNSEKDAVYIGESENILKRLNEHLASKDFWNEAVFFTNKDDNLTKSHIKYLEARLIEICKSANRHTLLNGNNASLSALPKSDKDSMEELLNNIKTLLGVMRYKVLEPTTSPKEQKNFLQQTENTQEIELTLNIKGISATAVYTDEGIVVKKGSEANILNQSSLAQGRRNLKQTLIDNGTLKPKNDKLYEFSEDHVFNSSSQAAAVIVGYLLSGPQNWYHNGKTLKEIEENREV
ncbi:GIY-YIG nuclease family protein [Mannheimia bovis]|uniref:GIY-YIG nuclease family protein n=1 Tax=Mannheimia bovis TaxID=2770636 RepID=UPI0024B6FA5D|nr:GIY-YIG nuclease family protein [Mannheimia bovis]WHP47218.1 GIY-YIG nuclease family protein [Mannheimia bovis]